MDSAYLKVKRAEKHLAELSQMFRRNKPFGYYLETNYKTGERATFAKRNEDVANEAAIVIGDVLHNLRAAIDHAYWSCTEKHAKSDRERKNIQFPITSTETALRDSILPGLPSRVSQDFANALASLKPYRDGGNLFLCAIHDLDVMDKHKLLVPTGNFTKINSTMIQRLVPDFPSGLTDCGAGNCYRDVVWRVQPMTWTQRRKAKIPPSNIIEQELDVPVEIIISDIDPTKPAIQTLQELIDLTICTIKSLYSGAGINVD
ncbi:hypothetical protein VHA01S_028_00400 [Vibrio halioticoli NBRC 102217]|uniref:Uncharacterized protein n=1 Tax=Vibrio halioticoli NBRC 102217 TaxID=1219072 RepID=V5FJ68_9VIBR|nr:hypothetical protein [Vibrio halioticoli]GAD89841.1 hypothetical protein VHA01S_028_00400 [Vibrio halioticoli NBRC 102217]